MNQVPDSILIVEPSKTLSESIRNSLRKEGYAVSVVHKGVTAKKKIGHASFSLILLSQELPDIPDTLTLLAHIKTLYPETLVIMMFDKYSKEIAIEASRRGAYDFLDKSCTLEELKIVVKKSLDRRRLGIKNKMLFEEIQKKNVELEWRVMELTALYEISRTIASQPTLDEALRGISESIKQVIPVDYFLCLSFNPELHEFHLRFAQGIDENVFKRLSLAKVKIDPPPADPSLEDDCVSIYYTRHVMEFLKDEGFHSLLLESFLAIPIIIENDLYGLFAVASHHKNIFSAMQKQLLSIISSQALSLYEKADRLTKSTQLIIMGQMISEIAHDLRHPITIIKGALQNLDSKWYDDSFRIKSLEVVNHGIFRLNELVKELLEFTNPHHFPMKSVDLNQTIQKVLRLVQNDLLRHKITMVQDITDLPLVRINEERIKEAFLNIIVNSIEAMEKGGTLTISTRTVKREGDKPKDYVQVAFRDTGVGIVPEVQKRIFDHFFSTKESGTGLGLAVVNRVIKTHNGYVEVESTVGKGSTFSLHLPVENEC